MKTKRISIPEDKFENSKFETKEWESRVNIARWEHDFENKIYHIDIKVKK